MAYRKPLPGGGLPQSSNPNKAGASLASAEARRQFGDQAEVGASGERHFAQILKQHAFDQTCDIFYSLGIPQGKHFGAKALRSDVDVAVVNGNSVILIDVKRWKGSCVYLSLGGLPFRDLTPLQSHGGWKMSANMAQALRRYREALPGVNVTAMVVFVPTHRGVAPTSVRWLKWPGGVRSFLVPAAIRELRARVGVERQVPDARIIGLLNRMQR